MLLAISDAVHMAYLAMATSVICAFIPIILIIVRDHLDRKTRKEQAEDIKTIKSQTNHLATELAKRTGEAKFSEGRIAERKSADDREDNKKVIEVLGEPVETIADDIADIKEVIEGQK